MLKRSNARFIWQLNKLIKPIWRIRFPLSAPLYMPTNRITARFDNIECSVYKIRNDFFGESVTVAGLLTGGDIAAQLKKAMEEGTDLGEAVVFPRCALRADGDLFLDDMTPEELSAKIGLPAIPSGPGGAEYVDSLLGIGN